jgi:hypothetical protein
MGRAASFGGNSFGIAISGLIPSIANRGTEPVTLRLGSALKAAFVLSCVAVAGVLAAALLVAVLDPEPAELHMATELRDMLAANATELLAGPDRMAAFGVYLVDQVDSVTPSTYLRALGAGGESGSQLEHVGSWMVDSPEGVECFVGITRYSGVEGWGGWAVDRDLIADLDAGRRHLVRIDVGCGD